MTYAWFTKVRSKVQRVLNLRSALAATFHGLFTSPLVPVEKMVSQEVVTVTPVTAGSGPGQAPGATEEVSV